MRRDSLSRDRGRELLCMSLVSWCDSFKWLHIVYTTLFLGVAILILIEPKLEAEPELKKLQFDVTDQKELDKIEKRVFKRARNWAGGFAITCAVRIPSLALLWIGIDKKKAGLLKFHFIWEGCSVILFVIFKALYLALEGRFFNDFIAKMSTICIILIAGCLFLPYMYRKEILHPSEPLVPDGGGGGEDEDDDEGESANSSPQKLSVDSAENSPAPPKNAPPNNAQGDKIASASGTSK